MIKSHVPSLETCKRMQELGWDKVTIFEWGLAGEAKSTSQWEIQYSDDESCERWEFAPAPLASEIMEELPARNDIKHFSIGRYADTNKYYAGLLHYNSYPDCLDGDKIYTIQENPAEALALLWIKLKEEGVI